MIFKLAYTLPFVETETSAQMKQEMKGGGGKPGWDLVSCYLREEGCIVSAVMKNLGDKGYKGPFIPAEIWVYFNVTSNFREKVGSVSSLSYSSGMPSKCPHSQMEGCSSSSFPSPETKIDLFIYMHSHLLFVTEF